MRLEFHQLDLRFNHLRATRPDLQRRLLASLGVSGQQTPIVVVALSDQPGRYLVIDGYKRIAALEQLGRDTVEAVQWPMSEAEAVVLDRSMRFSGSETALEEGWLLAELEERFGYGVDKLARLFDRSVGWVTRRLELVELLPERVQEQVRNGKITAHVATKYLVAVARVSLDDCLRMAEAVARLRFNTRQASELYKAWRESSPLTRERILDQPELYLKARRQVGRQSPPTPVAELLGDLEIIVAIAKRAGRRVGCAAVEMNQEQCRQARLEIKRAVDQLSELARRIPKEEEHVEQRAADGDSGTRSSGSEPPPDRPRHGYLPTDGASGHRFELRGRAGARQSRESLALPGADPRTVEELQGEPGSGP
jgi:ParB/RepB/Spo0J family partition protein